MKQNPSTTLTLWLMLVVVCQPAFAEPSGVRKAAYAQGAARSTAKAERGAQRDRGEPALMPDAARASERPLPPRGVTRGATGEKPNGRNLKPAGSLATGLASLAVVLGLFLAAAWAVRRAMPAASAKLPNEVVEVLGRTPLTGRQFAHLIRCGNKLLLVHLAPGCAETLTEITDPVEVDRLAGLCRAAHPHSATTSFRQVLQQWGKKHD